MSSITVTVSGNTSSSPGPNYRYWYDTIWWREGVRSGVFVRDYFKTGGSLSLFLSGGGVEDTDYVNTLEES